MLGDHLFAHLYKELIVFLKTRDHSLVQISGTNVFNFLSDKFTYKPKDQEQHAAGSVLGAPATTTDSGEVQFTEKQKSDAPCHKYRLKHATDMYQLNLPKSQWEEQVNRNRLFYCAHQNRKNAFFRKHMINAKGATVENLAAKIYAEQFGFVRIRRSLQEGARKIIETVVGNL